MTTSTTVRRPLRVTTVPVPDVSIDESNQRTHDDMGPQLTTDTRQPSTVNRQRQPSTVNIDVDLLNYKLQESNSFASIAEL